MFASFATVPDLLRLVVVLVFGWAALRDVRTRRLPNRIWPPLYALGFFLLAFEAVQHVPFATFEGRLFLIQAAISLLFVAPLGYAFWYLGAFGGADAKALIALAIVFPTFPTYLVGTTVLPLVATDLGVFSLTILTNTVLFGLVYPVGLGAYNLASGRLRLAAFLARPVATESLPKRHGRLFEDTSGVTRNGLDLDALRMYLRWRGLTLAEVRADPDRLRDPETVTETFDPTDGGTHIGPVTDGGTVSSEETESGEDTATEEPFDDPWAAERFLSAIEGTAYGTDAETLREGLTVVCRREEVWVSPGMPFIVPMFFGLVVAVVYGDVLFAGLGLFGLV